MRNRAWVLPTWFEHIERAFHYLDVELIYAFAIGSCDDDTELVIYEHAPNALVTFTSEAPIPDTATRWAQERFGEMAIARNALLGLVRAEDPDYFFSVDSDILLHERVIPNLIETYFAQPWAAVGGKLYMTPSGTHCPSYAFNKAAGGLAREDSEGVFQVEIIMALKLIGADALQVDYGYSDKGEDVSWSLACRDAGLKLGWDGRVANKHVMVKRQLYEADPRVGF